MANEKPKSTPIDAGIVARVSAGLRYMISGDQTFFGPQQPLAPAAQEATVGRQFDYVAGQNIQIAPRASEAISFQQLREVADGYDLMRLAIETRKDQVARMKWTVKPVDDKAQSGPEVAQLIELLRFPDGETDWSTWLRAFVEDILVLDAGCIYPCYNRGGALIGLEMIDPSTIKRVISVDGRTPKPPEVAYQQILKGVPAADYSTSELIYAIRNKRNHKIYGYSPVEQVLMTVNIALRRQVDQLNHYTAGNIPEAFIGVPAEWTPDQIGAFQIYWDSIMEGDLMARRQAKFVPGGMNVMQTRESSMKDAYDEWLSRIICFAFSISPGALIKDQNRATSETQKSSAKEEGLEPLMDFIEASMNRVLRLIGCAHLQFVFEEEIAEDPKTQAEINQIYVNAGVVSRNEVRVKLGLDPIDEDGMDQVGPVAAPSMFSDMGAEDDDMVVDEDGQGENETSEGKEGERKDPVDQPKKSAKARSKLFDVHVHLPQQVLKFEPIIDVQSPVVHAHVNLDEASAAARVAKKG